MTALAILVPFSYLLGSIPFGYLLMRYVHDQDVRLSGSGNIGATNVARSSPALGLLTLLLDASKGSIAVAVAIKVSKLWYEGNFPQHSDIALRAALAGFLAILGHIFPIWLKFKGGKGVATGFGSFAVIAPKSALIMIAVFVVTLIAFRYVSLSSMLSVALFPFFVWILCEYRGEPYVLALTSICSVMIVLKHHENIRRLLSGTEPKFELRRA